MPDVHDEREHRIEDMVDIMMEADRTADRPTVFTMWHHYAEALANAGYVKPEYEYRVARRWRDADKFEQIGPWHHTLEEALDVLDRNVDINIRHKTGNEFKLVKRIAHGKVEDA